METESRPKRIFDYKHVAGVTAIALLKDGKEAGKIIANWSDNPSGSVCTAQVFLYGQEWRTKPIDACMIGKAGGYGYDKLSQAIYCALRVGGLEKIIKVEPASGNQRTAFEDAGFTWVEVC